MTDTSSSPVQLTPSSSFGYGYEYGTGSSYSPRCSPGPGLPQQQQQRQQQQQPARAHIVRQNSVGGGNIGKPSPYSPKAHPDTSIDTRSTRAGIGGPPKRRESLSGIGNNLRSGNPAALGRSVGKIPGQQPSGLSNLLQQGNAANPAQSASTGVERTQSPQETDNLPLGSPAKASVIYAPVHRESAIGGSTEGKAIMQDRPGLGGSAGKAWMADRPSNLGEAAFSDAHPESGFTKLLRALNISSSKNEDPNKASPSPNSPITPTSPKNQ
ncbi:hypothetical protein GGI07_002641 [Coemansia sp. Benny D115]|nr:hypothetical protein GGI07_002641 [Coemansia sp. Benny D115]